MIKKDKIMKTIFIIFLVLGLSLAAIISAVLMVTYQTQNRKDKERDIGMPIDLLDKSGYPIQTLSLYTVVIMGDKEGLEKEALVIYESLKRDNIPVSIAVRVKDRNEIPQKSDFFKQIKQEPLYYKSNNNIKSPNYKLLFDKYVVAEGTLMSDDDRIDLIYKLDNENLITKRNLFMAYMLPENRPKSYKPIISNNYLISPRSLQKSWDESGKEKREKYIETTRQAVNEAERIDDKDMQTVATESKYSLKDIIQSPMFNEVISKLQEENNRLQEALSNDETLKEIEKEIEALKEENRLLKKENAELTTEITNNFHRERKRQEYEQQRQSYESNTSVEQDNINYNQGQVQNNQEQQSN